MKPAGLRFDRRRARGRRHAVGFGGAPTASATPLDRETRRGAAERLPPSTGGVGAAAGRAVRRRDGRLRGRPSDRSASLSTPRPLADGPPPPGPPPTSPSTLRDAVRPFARRRRGGRRPRGVGAPPKRTLPPPRIATFATTGPRSEAGRRPAPPTPRPTARPPGGTTWGEGTVGDGVGTPSEAPATVRGAPSGGRTLRDASGVATDRRARRRRPRRSEKSKGRVA